MSDLTNLKPPFVSVTPFGWNTAKTRMIGGMRIGYLLKRRSLTLMLSKESLTSNTINQALWVVLSGRFFFYRKYLCIINCMNKKVITEINKTTEGETFQAVAKKT